MKRYKKRIKRIDTQKQHNEVSSTLEYIGGNKTALIVLHEIYGVNRFIKNCCRQYHEEEYDVFCPDLFSGQAVFPYSKAEEAYHAYQRAVGFEAYTEINSLALRLKQTYKKVVVVGFSVGATLAWQCSERPLYSGIVCCYGSRIRDYLAVTPQCPVLLIFAKQDAFDAASTAEQLRGKKGTTLEILDAKHGFADCYSDYYNWSAAEQLNKLRQDFLAACTT